MSARSDMARGFQAGFGFISVVLTTGLIAVVIAFGNGQFDDGYRLSAVFPTSSQGLFTDGGTDVKMRGINVGTVDAIDILDDGRARITLFIDPDVKIPQSASASIEPLSVFGPKFINLDPGDMENGGPWLGEGAEIAHARTGAELTRIIDRATDLLRLIDPAKVQAVTSAFSEGVRGLGGDLGSTIDSGTTLAAIGARHAEDLRIFLTDLAALSGTFSESTGAFVSTVGHLNELLPTINARSGDIDELLDVTVRISNNFADLLDRHGADFGVTVDAFGAFVHGVYEESARIPDLLDLVGTFFGGMSDIIRFHGPANTETMLAALRGFLALDLCKILNVCPGAL